MHIEDASFSTADIKRVREETVQRRNEQVARKRLTHHLGVALIVFALFCTLVVLGVSLSA